MAFLLEKESGSSFAISRIVHSPANWDQIENQQEVVHTLEAIQSATRFDVFKSAELYDLAYPGYEGDTDYYLEKGKSGRVLYLGVGTGRLFAPLARRNPNMVGLDVSSEMLELLRRKNPDLRRDQVLEADALSADLGENKFDSVIAPYSFLQYFDKADMAKLLANVRRALKPGGKFHTDSFSPFLIPFRKKGLETSIRSVGRDTRISIYVIYNHILQTMKELAVISKSSEPDRVLEMNMFYYFPHEVSEALKNAGFEESHVIGDYQDELFDPTEHEIVVYEAIKPSNLNKANGRKGLVP